MNACCLADAYFSFEDLRLFWIYACVLISIWIVIPQDRRYKGLPSKVREIVNEEMWTRSISNSALVCFMDPSLRACAEYAPVHAALSARFKSVEFFFLYIKRNPEIASKARVQVQSQPVLVLYRNGKEVSRVGTEITTKKFPSHESLDRRFWYSAVQLAFSL